MLALLIALDTLRFQPVGPLPTGTIEGWVHTIRGEVFDYHSAHPSSRASLLVRSLDSTRAAVWETAPALLSGDSIRAVFLAAMDVVDPGQSPVRFHLTINDTHRLFLFQPRDTSNWSATGADGTRLDFERLIVDKFGDVHGVVTITTPRAALPPGPIRIGVHGEAVGRMSWFILYTVGMRPAVAVAPEAALVRDSGRVRQVIRADTWNPGPPRALVISIDGRAGWHGVLAPGGSTIRLPVDTVTSPRDVVVVADAGEEPARWPAVRLAPVRRREIHLINQAHLDIGYTSWQPNVLAQHWAGYDSAIALADRTRDYPEEARFRWNVEGLWPVEQYLAERDSATRHRFITAVGRGDLSLNAFYANLMTGLSGSDELIQLVAEARQLRKGGIPITTAITSDVPGLTWGLVPVLARSGVRWLSTGPNYQPGLPMRGDRIGHALAAWGDRPFWWMGPSGRDSLLVMTAGRGYSWLHSFPTGRLRVQDARFVTSYIEDLEANGYPYDIVQVRVAYGGDNGTPDPQISETVRRWNEIFVSPRLVISTLPKMFASFETRHGRVLPRLVGDLTGYWEDGAMSSAREQVMNRTNAARIRQAEVMATLTGHSLPAADRWAAWREVLLWSEHTWGADRSVSEPDSPDVVKQWLWKQARVLRGDTLSRALIARATPPPGPIPEIDLWNLSGFSWNSPVVELGKGLAGDQVRDQRGRPIPSQRLASGALAVQLASMQPLAATRILSRGGRSFAPPRGRAHAAGDSLWNGHLTVHIDSHTGAVASARWHGREFVDRQRGGLGLVRRLLGRDTAATVAPAGVVLAIVDSGPLVATIRVTASLPGTRSVRNEIALRAGDDAIRISVTIDKLPIRDPEAIHLGMPFAVPGGTIRMEQAFAIVRPDFDQVAGANRNLFPVQGWFDLSNDQLGVTVATPDTPLWQVGGLTAEAFKRPDGTEAWLTRALPGTEVIAYLMNNYWHTNFRADQAGPVTFRFVITPHGPFDPAEAVRLGAPPELSVLAAPAPTATPAPPLFHLDNPSVIVASVAPSDDRRATVVRLWNPTEATQVARLRWAHGPVRLQIGDLTGSGGRPTSDRIVIAPRDFQVVRVEPTRGEE